MSMSNYRLQQHVHLLDFVLFLFHILFFCFSSRDSLLLTRILLRNITTITTDDVHYGSSSATYERVRFIILVSERSVSSDSELLVRAMEQCLALSAAPFPHSHLTLLTATRHVIWKKNRPCICMQYSECTPGWWRKARTASTTKSNSMCALLFGLLRWLEAILWSLYLTLPGLGRGFRLYLLELHLWMELVEQRRRNRNESIMNRRAASCLESLS